MLVGVLPFAREALCRVLDERFPGSVVTAPSDPAAVAER
jgi:hypothetical protein